MNKNQIKTLKKLYKTGKIADISYQSTKEKDDKEIDDLIQKAEKMPAGNYEPISRELRLVLKGMVKEGDLHIPLEDLAFMSNQRGIEYYWIGHKPGKGNTEFCSERQYKRLRMLVRKNYLDHIPGWRLKLLSYQEAETLLKEGEKNISDMKFKE